MAHLRKPLATAVVLNTGITVIEAVAGLRANSLSLVMDAIHNLSDELALVLLLLAVMQRRPARGLVQAANGFNSVGLVVVSLLPLWHAVQRLAHPQSILGLVPIVVGLLAALGNWGVAQVLKPHARTEPAIRLAYLHNRGDALVSLAPAIAGFGVMVLDMSLVDPLVALGIGLAVLIPTLQMLVSRRQELFWPEGLHCGPTVRQRVEVS